MQKRNKTGGRAKGTPNKISTSVRTAIATILDSYFASNDFLADMQALEPKDRVLAIEKFTSYIAPKLQSTTLDLAEEKNVTIDIRLQELSEQ